MSWLGDLLSFTAGPFGTLFTNYENRKENERNRDFNASEAEKSRQFQRDEWTRQFDLQRDEWYNQLSAQQEAQYTQFLREAEYNNPQNQVKRMAQAGLNPSAILGGQGSSGLVSAATGNVHSAPAPSVPSGGTVSSPQASAASPLPMQNPMSGLQNVGSFLKDMASATKDNRLIDPMVTLLSRQIYSQELQNTMQETQNYIASVTKNAKVLKAYGEMQNEFMDLTLKKTIDENYQSDTFLKKAEAFLKEAQKKLTDEQYKILVFQVNHQLETWNADMNVKRAQANNFNTGAKQNVAQAEYFGALKATEDELRSYRSKHAQLINQYQRYVNSIQWNEVQFSDSTLDAKTKHALTQLVESAKREGLLTAEQEAATDIAIKNNNWWYLHNVVMPIIQVQQANTRNAVEAVKAVGGLLPW